MIAHVSGIPVEELVPLALAGGTSGLLVVGVWLRMRIHARMQPKPSGKPDGGADLRRSRTAGVR
jgi:hypothetical protein